MLYRWKFLSNEDLSKDCLALEVREKEIDDEISSLIAKGAAWICLPFNDQQVYVNMGQLHFIFHEVVQEPADLSEPEENKMDEFITFAD